jgi:hypothetical protein
MTTTILKYLIHSQGIDISNNQFHKGTDFSQRIDPMELMPWVPKSQKNSSSVWGYNFLFVPGSLFNDCAQNRDISSKAYKIETRKGAKLLLEA